MTSCGDTANNDAFLLRQFPQSLEGPAFEWYYSLENGSFKTWEEMSDAFRAKFAAISTKISLADLTNTRPREREAILDYIARWRNLSIKCDRQLSEPEAVELIVGNIKGWMRKYLSVANIDSYAKLFSIVSKLEESPPDTGDSTSQPRKSFNKKVEAKAAWAPKANKKKVLDTEASDDEEIEARPSVNRQANAVSNENNNTRPRKTLTELKNKPYSFKRDKVKKLFKTALKEGLQLPDSKRPTEANKTDDPNYCPYHRITGHVIEDCYVFKDWLERKIKAGEIELSENAVQNPAPHEQSNMVSHSVLEEDDPTSASWAIHLSKRTRKIIKQLQKEPSIKWRGDLTPIMTAKPSKPFRKIINKRKKGKKPVEPLKAPELTELQKYLKELEDYEQGTPVPITIRDFLTRRAARAILGIDALGIEMSAEDIESLFQDWIMSEEGASCNMVSCTSDSDEDEVVFVRVNKPKVQECRVALRSGTRLPERQSPQEGDNRATTPDPKGKILKDHGETSKAKKTVGDYNVLAQLRRVPASLSILDALMMSQDSRDALIYALQNPQEFQAYLAERDLPEALYTSQCNPAITFNDEDLLLGTTEHNRPLYLTGTCEGRKLNRVFIDSGASINIMPLKTIKNLTLSAKLTSNEKVAIHGFNQNTQRTIGSVTLSLRFGDLTTKAKFYVIDADTSYKALLGRPWLHENHVVPSTLHQCIKYVKDGNQRRIDGDVQPFAVHEAELQDAKYFFNTLTTLHQPKGQTKKPVPRWGSDTDSSSEEENEPCISEILPMFFSSSEDEGESHQFSLVIERIPEDHRKGLAPRQAGQIHELRTFVVPRKREVVDEKVIVHRPIVFYEGSLNYQNTRVPGQDEWSEEYDVGKREMSDDF